MTRSRFFVAVLSILAMFFVLPSAAQATPISDRTVAPSSTWRTSETVFSDYDFPDWCAGPSIMAAKITYEYRATSSRMYLRKVRITNLTSGLNFSQTVEVNTGKVVARPASGSWAYGSTKTLMRATDGSIAVFSSPWSRTSSGKYMTAFDFNITSASGGGTGCVGGILARFTRG